MPEEDSDHRAKPQAATMSLRMWVAWAVHLGLWFVYTCQYSLHELIAGCIATTIAIVGYIAVWRHGHVPFVPRWRDALQAWRLPWYAVSGTWEILHGLGLQLFTAKGAPSVLLEAPFRWGGDDARDTARRALAIIYTTLTPNFVVLDIIPPPKANERGTMLYHQILPGPVITMTQKLGVETQASLGRLD